MNKILISALLSLSIVAPATAQFKPGCNPTDGCQGGIGGEGLYATVCTVDANGRLSLRSGPGRNFGKIKEIRNGNRVALISPVYGADGYRWWNVLHNGNQGWVRADYVCGDPD